MAAGVSLPIRAANYSRRKFDGFYPSIFLLLRDDAVTRLASHEQGLLLTVSVRGT